MRTVFPTRRLALLALSTCALAQAPLLHAQIADYPSKPVKFVNAFTPGGPTDVLARSLGEALQTQFKQPFIVENKPGAAGNIGADMVAKSPADGYTVMIGIDTTFTVNPHIYPSMPFKQGDLKPLMVLATSGMMVVAHPSTGFKSLADMVTAGKSKGVNFSSAGNGSPGHLAAEVLGNATGTKIQHIPYKGNAPAANAVLAGEVDGGVLAAPTMLQHIKAGKITALAVTSRQRSKVAPDVPTVAEAGYPQLVQEILYVAMVPAAMPEPLMQTLQRGMLEALRSPDIQARLTALDLQVDGSVGAAASKRLADLSAQYGRIAKATNMKVD
ncbi:MULTISPECIES: Bug family tripartite tricarboxylate transporter substrate binding protein [Acidovorax]|uniref:Tripartite-type tricarboxylate transporter, receptor component TctC n=1 Tax=Acidovorax soli TaxID=592050 RepID=A0A1H4CKC7_9BURK|nr:MULTISPECIES: tripartite tricarboxylate transporter substrate binding protein [Acidovorax]SEA60773.1 Tripartite-type tricarboxylate transporter, receptor component TctC [Acidovorax soli]